MCKCSAGIGGKSEDIGEGYRRSAFGARFNPKRREPGFWASVLVAQPLLAVLCGALSAERTGKSACATKTEIAQH